MTLTASQLACLLDGIDWRNPQYIARVRRALDKAAFFSVLAFCASFRRFFVIPCRSWKQLSTAL